MAALISGSTLTTTQLRDLPGNQLAKTLTTPANGRPVKFKSDLKINIRRAKPSEHFLKATDTEASTPEEEDSIEEVVSKIEQNDALNNLDSTRTTLPSSRSGISLVLDLNLSKDSNGEVDRSSFRDSVSTLKSSSCGEELRKEGSSVPKAHVFSVAKERQLLDDLLQLDEEENERMYRVQTDEDLYLLWRNGESRRTSKASVETNQVKRIKSTKPAAASKPSATFLLKRASKIDIINAWETVSNRKPAQRSKEDRKLKPSTNYVYSNKILTAGEKNNATSDQPPFMFFHYTDTARYIQQYRNNHSCENPYIQHPSCCHDNSSQTFQDIQEASHPFKLDFQPYSLRNRLSNILTSTQNNKPNKSDSNIAASKDQTSLTKRLQSSPTAGYLSPVASRPSYLLKTPSPIENWNQLPESPSRLKYHLKKIWHSYEQKPPTGTQHHSSMKGLHCVDGSTGQQESPLKSESLKSKVTKNFLIPNGKGAEIDSNELEDSPAASASENVKICPKTSEETVEKVLTVPTLCDVKLEKSYHQYLTMHEGKHHQLRSKSKETILQEDFFPDAENQQTDGKYHYSSTSGSYFGEDTKTRYEKNKNLRMKSLIAAEITNLQKRNVISLDQKRKLDKFKQALSNMSDVSEKPSMISTLPPNGSSRRRFIAGSVRAYYTRTTHQDRYVTECVRPELPERWCDAVSSTDKQDDKPIIVVSQPHLRQFGDSETKKTESPLAKKKLIGGKVANKKQQHPADAKQFTRITDLLRIKKRQQSSRRVLSGTSAGHSSTASNRRRRNSATVPEQKSKHDETKDE